MASPAPPPTASGLEDAMARLSVDTTASLFNLPAPWLRQLTHQELGPKELVATSQTCQTLQHEVLTGRHVTLTAHMHRPGAQHRHISLQRACQHAASVHLKLSGSAPRASSARFNQAHTAQAYMAKAARSLGPTLMTKVAEATLEGMSLDGLVPGWLTDACPQLTSLCLDDVSFNLPFSTAPNTTLKCLTLPAPPEYGGRAEQITRDQVYSNHLQALRALERLTVSNPLSPTLMYALMVAPHWTRQLKTLHLSQQQDPAPVQSLFERASWSGLTELSIPQVFVPDQLLGSLLQQPALETVSCYCIAAETDHSSSTCSWKRLSVGVLGVGGLVNTPLHSLESITVRQQATDNGPRVAVVLSADPAKNDTVLGQVQRMGGLKWDVPAASKHDVATDDDAPATTLHISCYPPAPLCDSQLRAAVCLLSNFTTNTIVIDVDVTAHLTPSALQPLGQLSQPSRGYQWYLKLMSMSADPAVWPLLLSTLSGYDSVRLMLPAITLTEQAITTVLTSAPQPLGLEMFVAGLHASKGLKERVEAAAERAANAALAAGGWSALLPCVGDSDRSPRVCTQLEVVEDDEIVYIGMQQCPEEIAGTS